jgi:hypothetical protein
MNRPVLYDRAMLNFSPEFDSSSQNHKIIKKQ